MITVRSLRFSYGPREFLLALPTLNISAGEKVAIIGPSGSGKTTLLNLFSGICLPQDGSVEVCGTELSQLSDDGRRKFRAKNVGFVFQDAGLVDYLNGLENIIYPYRVGPSLKLDASVRARANQLASACGVDSRLRAFPSEMSGGERQRLAICRALVTQPKLVLADEPTGSLDPDNKLSVLNVLFERAADLGATVVVVTHDHGLLGHFDRVIEFSSLGVRV